MKPTLIFGGLLCTMSIAYVTPLVDSSVPYTLQGFMLDLHESPFLTVGVLALKTYLLYSLGIITIPAALAAGKREVSEPYGQYLEMARQLDPEGCLPRFVCEIVASPKEEEDDEVLQQIKNFFSKAEAPVYPFISDPTSARFAFEYASLYGRMTKDPKSCSNVYPSCQTDSDTLKRLVIEAFHSNL